MFLLRQLLEGCRSPAAVLCCDLTISLSATNVKSLLIIFFNKKKEVYFGKTRLFYSGESFQRNYPEFIQKYHFADLYTASFYDFPTQEEKWAFWARLIQQNRFNEKPLELYQKLYH